MLPAAIIQWKKIKSRVKKGGFQHNLERGFKGFLRKKGERESYFLPG